MNGLYLLLVLILFCQESIEVSNRDQTKVGFDINDIFNAGPFTPSEVSYEYPILNDTELTPTSTNLTTQIRGQLFFPNTTVNRTMESFPILIFLPGKHADCRLLTPPGYPALDLEATDPLGRCPFGLPTVPSHLGYAYLGQYFASHGYIVSSIDVVLINNKWGVPGDDTLNFVRARLVLRTLQKMLEWHNNAEVSKQILHGVDLSGRFDFGQVGLMGHSRGGEAVRNAYNMLMENRGPSDASQWRARLPNVMIRAVMEVAPMYYGQNGTKLGVENIPWAMIVAGCEDDETDYAHVYLAYHQLRTAKRPNYVIHVYGANHEYFNTEWQTGLNMCFGDQDPLWDVNASTFKVSDVYPPAKDTPLDLTLLKINGSESQRRTAIFSLATFFRAYVGATADPSLARFLEPSNPLPTNLTEIGRQYFNNGQSLKLFNGTGHVSSAGNASIISLKLYAQSIYPDFVRQYDNSPSPPPHFSFSPPQKGNLSLGCLDQIENAVHINFQPASKSEILVAFDRIERGQVREIDIQMARRSTCWFTSSQPSTCAEPRTMIVDVQLQTDTGFVSATQISVKSRYNLEFTRCDAMDFPPEKIGFLPVMFETVRVPVGGDVKVRGLKMISQQGGSLILGDISATIQSSSAALSLSICFTVFWTFLLVDFSQNKV